MDKKIKTPFTNKTPTKKARRVSIFLCDEGYLLFVEGVCAYAMLMLVIKVHIIGCIIVAENLLGFMLP